MFLFLALFSAAILGTCDCSGLPGGSLVLSFSDGSGASLGNGTGIVRAVVGCRVNAVSNTLGIDPFSFAALSTPKRGCVAISVLNVTVSVSLVTGASPEVGTSATAKLTTTDPSYTIFHDLSDDGDATVPRPGDHPTVPASAVPFGFSGAGSSCPSGGVPVLVSPLGQAWTNGTTSGLPNCGTMGVRVGALGATATGDGPDAYPLVFMDAVSGEEMSASVGTIAVSAPDGVLVPGAIVTLALAAPINATTVARGHLRLELCGGDVTCDNGGSGQGSSSVRRISVASVNPTSLTQVVSAPNAPLADFVLQTVDPSGDAITTGPATVRNVTLYVLSSPCEAAFTARSASPPPASSVVSSRSLVVTDTAGVVVASGLTLGPSPVAGTGSHSVLAVHNTAGVALADRLGGTCLPVTVVAGTPNKIMPTVETLPSNIIADTSAFAAVFAVKVTDAAGNVVNPDPVNTRDIILGCVPPASIGGTCTASSSTAQSTVLGSGTIAGLFLVRPKAGNGYKLTFGSTTLPGVGHVLVNVVKGAPAGVAAIPDSLTIATAFPVNLPQFDIAVIDAAGNPLDNSDAAITRVVTLVAASSGLGFVSRSLAINPPGRGRVVSPATSLSAAPKPDVYTITIATVGLASGTLSVNITRGQIASLGLASYDLEVNAGSVVPVPPLTVIGYDASGTFAGPYFGLDGLALANRTLRAVIRSFPTGAGTTLSGVTVVEMEFGQAVFSNLTLLHAAEGNVTVRFEDTGGSASPSPEVTIGVKAGLPVKLRALNVPSTIQATWPLLFPTLEVSGVDLNGALSFTGETGTRTLTATILTRPSPADSSPNFASFPAPIAVMASGKATFVGLRIEKAYHGVYTVLIEDASKTLNGTFSFTVVAGPVAGMALSFVNPESLFPLNLPYLFRTKEKAELATVRIQARDAAGAEVALPSNVVVNITAECYHVTAAANAPVQITTPVLVTSLTSEPTAGDTATQSVLTRILPASGRLLWSGLSMASPPHGTYSLTMKALANTPGVSLAAGSIGFDIVSGDSLLILSRTPVPTTVTSAEETKLPELKAVITDASGSQVTDSNVEVTLMAPLEQVQEAQVVSGSGAGSNGTVELVTVMKAVTKIGCVVGPGLSPEEAAKAATSCLKATSFRGAVSFTGVTLASPRAGTRIVLATARGNNLRDGEIKIEVLPGEAKKLSVTPPAALVDAAGRAIPRKTERKVPLTEIVINAADTGGNLAGGAAGTVVAANVTKSASTDGTSGTTTTTTTRSGTHRFSAEESLATALSALRYSLAACELCPQCDACRDALAMATAAHQITVSRGTESSVPIAPGCVWPGWGGDAENQGMGGNDIDDDDAMRRNRAVVGMNVDSEIENDSDGDYWASLRSTRRVVLSTPTGTRSIAIMQTSTTTTSDGSPFVACGPALVGTTAKAIGTDGKAVFSDLAMVDPCPGGYEVSFSAVSGSLTGLSLATFPVAITVGDPYAVALRTQPPELVRPLVVLNPAPVADLRDLYGNAVAVAGVRVSVRPEESGLRLVNDEALNSLTTDSFGVARFSGLLAEGTPGSSYRLRLFADGMAAVLSSPFTFEECPVNQVPEGLSCKCIPGHAGVGCSPCGVGLYQPIIGQESCLSCPTNMITEGNSLAATSEDKCVCDKGFYEADLVAQFASGSSSASSSGNGNSTGNGTSAAAGGGANDTSTATATVATVTGVRRSCVVCPEEARCNGGAHIEPRPGYWRFSNSSLRILACRKTTACLGGYNSSCAVGFDGNLCTGCEDTHGKLGNTCTECPGRAWSIVVFVLTVIFVILLVSFLSFSAQLLTKRRGAGIQKIFLNYIQITALLGSFHIEFPSSLRSLLSFAQGAGMLSVRIPTVDCAFKLSYFDEFRAHLLLPVLGMVCLGLVLAAIAIFRLIKPRILEDGLPEPHDEVRGRLLSSGMATFFVIVFLTHPLITKECLQVFNCEDLGDPSGDKYLSVDLSIKCSGSDYDSTVGLSIVVIIAYVLAMPALMFGVLYYHRAELHEARVRRRIQLLFEGFRQDRYYWELVVVARKIAMVAIVVFIDAPLKQAYAGLVLLLLAIMMHMFFRPFTTAKLQSYELTSLMCTYVTLMLALLYQAQVSEDSDFSDSAGATAFAAVLILINSIVTLVFAYEIARRQRVVLQFTVSVLKRVGMQIDDDTDTDYYSSDYEDNYGTVWKPRGGGKGKVSALRQPSDAIVSSAAVPSNGPADKEKVLKGSVALTALEARFKSAPGEDLGGIDDILGSEDDSGGNGSGQAPSGLTREALAKRSMLGSRFANDLAPSTLPSIDGLSDRSGASDGSGSGDGGSDRSDETGDPIPAGRNKSGAGRSGTAPARRLTNTLKRPATLGAPMFQMVNTTEIEEPRPADKKQTSASQRSLSNASAARGLSSAPSVGREPSRSPAEARSVQSGGGANFSLDQMTLASMKARQLGSEVHGRRNAGDVTDAVNLMRTYDPHVLRAAADMAVYTTRDGDGDDESDPNGFSSVNPRGVHQTQSYAGARRVTSGESGVSSVRAAASIPALPELRTQQSRSSSNKSGTSGTTDAQPAKSLPRHLRK